MTTKYVTKTIPIENILDNYKGKSINQIVKEFGPPDKKNSDGSGGEIYTYEENQQFAYRYNFEYYPGSITTIKERRYFIDFYFNKSGLVYFFRTNYPDVEEKKAVGKKIDSQSIWDVILIGVIAVGTIFFVTSYQ